MSNRLPALTSIKQVSLLVGRERERERERESGATSTEGRTEWLGKSDGGERKVGGDTLCYWNERLPDIGCLITVVVVNTEHNYRQTGSSVGVH